MLLLSNSLAAVARLHFALANKLIKYARLLGNHIIAFVKLLVLYSSYFIGFGSYVVLLELPTHLTKCWFH